MESSAAFLKRYGLNLLMFKDISRILVKQKEKLKNVQVNKLLQFEVKDAETGKIVIKAEDMGSNEEAMDESYVSIQIYLRF